MLYIFFSFIIYIFSFHTGDLCLFSLTLVVKVPSVYKPLMEARVTLHSAVSCPLTGHMMVVLNNCQRQPLSGLKAIGNVMDKAGCFFPFIQEKSNVLLSGLCHVWHETCSIRSVAVMWKAKPVMRLA